MTRHKLAALVRPASLLLVHAALACSRPEQPKSEPLRTVSNSPKPPATVMDTVALTSSDVPMPLPDLRHVQSAHTTSGDARKAILTLLNRARKGGKDQVEYRAPQPADLATYATAMRQLLEQAATGEVPVDIALDGFQFESLGADYIAFIEAANRRQGAAAVVLRVKGAEPIAIEVPHSFYDEATLPIGLELFLATRARMLSVNTVHRYRSIGGHPPAKAVTGDDEPKSAESDVAHSSRSFFLAAHEAFLDKCAGGLVVQVHGFSDANAPGADAVISAARTSASIDPLAARLRSALNLRALVYPKDTRKLGGTQNAQAQSSRSRAQRFIHLELSQSLRRRLLGSESLMTEFALAVAAEAR